MGTLLGLLENSHFFKAFDAFLKILATLPF